MRKVFLLLLSVILLSGCTVSNIDNKDYKEVMNKILSLDINLYNSVGKGYKYYMPYGVVRTYSNDYNDTLKKDGRNYYLYVDAVSYYYKTKSNYKINKKAYYSKKIRNKGKEGYIEIIKDNDKLYITMLYNYAKIETYVNESELKDSIIDMSYILSSVNFNDSVLKKMYESDNFESKEEAYKLFDSKDKEGNFLDYIKEYDKYESNDSSNKEDTNINVKETTTKQSDTTQNKTSSNDNNE